MQLYTSVDIQLITIGIDEKNVDEFIQISDRPSTVSELRSIPKSNPIFSFPLRQCLRSQKIVM